MINVDQKIEPFEPKLVQAGAPHNAAFDAALAQQTSALWWRCMPTRRAWGWPDPDTAPFISSATTGTYDAMSIGDPVGGGETVDFQLPWHFQKGSHNIQAVGLFITPEPDLRAKVRLATGDFDSAIVAPAYSAGTTLILSPAAPPGLWARLEERRYMAKAIMSIPSTTTENFTADRRGTLRVEVNFDYRTDPDDIGAKHLVRLYSLLIAESFSPPTPDDEA